MTPPRPPSESTASPRPGWGDAPVTVELWRDHDPAARRSPGMAMGARKLTGDWAARVTELWASGARMARLVRPVRLLADDPVSARALVLVRELTAHGFAVDWEAECRAGHEDLRLLGHLYPPSRITTGLDPTRPGVPRQVFTEATRTWRERYLPAACVFRRGPGFVQVRDRRFGTLELITIDEPGHLAALDPLIQGIPVDRVSDAVRRDLAGARLVAEHTGHLWWLPTRIHRWPFPSFLV